MRGVEVVRELIWEEEFHSENPEKVKIDTLLRIEILRGLKCSFVPQFLPCFRDSGQLCPPTPPSHSFSQLVHVLKIKKRKGRREGAHLLVSRASEEDYLMSMLVSSQSGLQEDEFVNPRPGSDR